MEFRDLKKQYNIYQTEIDSAIQKVLQKTNFIGGNQVKELETKLAEYVGVKHCITCANGTDALNLALLVWGIGKGDAVFVPDFTFFASGEVVAYHGATPIFVDVNADTFNIDPIELEKKILQIRKEGNLTPKAIIAVDLFGQPAEYDKIHTLAQTYKLHVLEDAAQGFGGMITGKMAGSFGDIATTSFFPAKPLGCYGDGGAIFTDADTWAEKLRSLCIHGKGSGKYDNIQVGVNSRLDTIQAAILLPKLKAFIEYERDAVNKIADIYNKQLKNVVKIPSLKTGYVSSWAQYTVQLHDKKERDSLQKHLKQFGIPSMIYYPKPMHLQGAFEGTYSEIADCPVSEKLCNTVLSLPMHPYLEESEQNLIIQTIRRFF